MRFIIFLVVAGFIFSGCSKSNEGTTRLEIRLTDNPFNADEVNVDIEKVRIKMADDDDDDQLNNNNQNDDSEWIDLKTTVGIYNLLDYQNGLDTVIASGPVPAGAVKEIRFVLGSDNSIVIGSQIYPLTVPSGSESGLKVKVDKDLNKSVEDIIVDFDADLSVHQTGNGNYILKPVLRIKN